jgi:hypothetical protein
MTKQYFVNPSNEDNLQCRLENCACWFLRQLLGSFWFLIMSRKIGLLGDTFYQDCNLLDYPIEEKSWWQPQIEATYMRKSHGDSLMLSLTTTKTKVRRK